MEFPTIKRVHSALAIAILLSLHEINPCRHTIAEVKVNNTGRSTLSVRLNPEMSTARLQLARVLRVADLIAATNEQNLVDIIIINSERRILTNELHLFVTALCLRQSSIANGHTIEHRVHDVRACGFPFHYVSLASLYALSILEVQGQQTVIKACRAIHLLDNGASQRRAFNLLCAKAERQAERVPCAVLSKSAVSKSHFEVVNVVGKSDATVIVIVIGEGDSPCSRQRDVRGHGRGEVIGSVAIHPATEVKVRACRNDGWLSYRSTFCHSTFQHRATPVRIECHGIGWHIDFEILFIRAVRCQVAPFCFIIAILSKSPSNVGIAHRTVDAWSIRTIGTFIFSRMSAASSSRANSASIAAYATVCVYSSTIDSQRTADGSTTITTITAITTIGIATRRTLPTLTAIAAVASCGIKCNTFDNNLSTDARITVRTFTTFSTQRAPSPILSICAYSV